MTTLWLVNVAAFSVQLTIVVATAVVALAVLRVRAPGPALQVWQLALLVATTLPFILSSVAATPESPTGTTAIIAYSLATSSISTRLRGLTSIAILALGCGAAARVLWLTLGLTRLRGIRRRSTPLTPIPAFVDDLSARLGVRAEIRVSDEVDGPVTIGLRRPLILFPRRALTLPAPLQRAIACHELIHVKRGDWSWNLLEQAWCALLWFHPAAHLLVARLDLMREAVVDRDAVAMTGDRKVYARALLAFAEPATAPATVLSLSRPRHLSRRIALITKEAPMSRRHVVAGLIGAVAVTSAAAVAGASRFPMVSSTSAPIATPVTEIVQAPVRPGNGVSVPRVIRDVKPRYTPAAMRARIHGSVFVEAVVLANGDVGEVTVVKSLDTEHGLDEEAVQAVSQWKFEPGRRKGSPVPVLVTIEMTFTLK